MVLILAFFVASFAGLAAATACTSDVAIPWYDFNHPKGSGGGDGKCTPEDIQNGNTLGCASNWIGTRDVLRASSALECDALEMCFSVSDGSLLCFNPTTGYAHDDEGGEGNLFTGVVTDSHGRVTTVTPGAVLSASATATVLGPGSVSRASTTSKEDSADASTPTTTTTAVAITSASASPKAVVPTSTPSSALSPSSGGVSSHQIGFFSLVIAQLPFLGVHL